MVCDTCVGLITRHEGLIFTGTFDLTFKHHESTTSLRQSLGVHCSICTRLATVLSPDTDIGKDQPLSFRAYLKKTRFTDEKWRGCAFTLDFEFGGNRSCTFLLAEIGTKDVRQHMISADILRC